LLIIFDLDDTLIDTSGCIVPLKLKDALDTMIAAGLEVKSRQKTYSLLLDISKDSITGGDALRTFLERIKGNPGLLDMAVQEYYGNIKGEFKVNAFPHAKKILEHLRNDHHTLVLVTQGITSQQHEKMRKARIDPILFDEIIVSPTSDKKPHYEKVIGKYRSNLNKSKTTLNKNSPDFNNSNIFPVIVCGDRWKTDLKPAHELGFSTVHMQQGRGAHDIEEDCTADYNITSLSELIPIVKEVECKQ